MIRPKTVISAIVGCRLGRFGFFMHLLSRSGRPRDRFTLHLPHGDSALFQYSK